MKATITYKIDKVPYPWNEDRRRAGETAWCLVKVTKPEYGRTDEEPVALFNLDSEAKIFQGHVFAAKLDGDLVSIHPSIAELCERGVLG
jgi:hypothetical protein